VVDTLAPNFLQKVFPLLGEGHQEAITMKLRIDHTPFKAGFQIIQGCEEEGTSCQVKVMEPSTQGIVVLTSFLVSLEPVMDSFPVTSSWDEVAVRNAKLGRGVFLN
jgi:hypothetical protein